MTNIESIPHFNIEKFKTDIDLEIDELQSISDYNGERLAVLQLEKIDNTIKLQLNTDDNFLLFEGMESVRNHVSLSIDKVYGMYSSQGLKDTFIEIIELKLTDDSFEKFFYLMELRRILDDFHINMY